MVFGINNKPLKVVWLCHFANQEMKDYFNTPDVKEMAPWIYLLIELIKNNNEIELHVVAPNVFNNSNCEIKRENIKYYFYKYSLIPIKNRYIRKFYSILQVDLRTNFWRIRHKVSNIINKINPDIIHLHGAENPYYSAGILSLLDKYPTITTIQGFIRNSINNDSNTKKRIEIEETILKKTKNIGVRTDEMSKLVLQINPNAKLHFHNYPLNKPTLVKNNIGKEEPIDCIFFARIQKDKGIEDLLIAISIVKKSYTNVSLSVIGNASKSYLSHLKTLCSDLDIVNNVKFLGFLRTQENIFQIAEQAKICVLPTYHDIIPGTIIESMFMKLPVIAYAVGGIPELNKKESTIMLVDKKNINQLAEKIILLINNADLRKTIAEKAHNQAYELFNNSNVITNILKAYKSILIKNYIN